MSRAVRLLVFGVALCVGCVAPPQQTPPTGGVEASLSLPAASPPPAPTAMPVSYGEPVVRGPVIPPAVTPVARAEYQDTPSEPEPLEPPPPQPAELPGDSNARAGALPLDEVIDSVYRSFPLLEAAYFARDIAAGDQLSALGEFDLKVKGASEHMPLGFYENYRNYLRLVQPLYPGSDLIAGYRNGRGVFQPWYLERETNKGGELMLGMAVPLARNREIDARRAELWRTTYGRQLVELEIAAQVIGFVREASYAYWDWVSAGRRYDIAEEVLDLARDRNEGIARKVEEGDTEPPVLQDNERLIVSRQAKLIDARRKLQQTAVKLSLFYRAEDGRPLIAWPDRLPPFPEPDAVDPARLQEDIAIALSRRPEIQALDVIRRQLDVDWAEARNEYRPLVDALVGGSQDLGEPASSKRDKSPFELEANLYVEMPVQRRKARGKMTAVQAKINQVAAKRQMTQDKVATDVQATYAALYAAYQQTQQAREAVRLAMLMADIERRKFELGESDLLSVNLREQQAVDAELTEVDALQEFFLARADYRAALALDRLALAQPR